MGSLAFAVEETKDQTNARSQEIESILDLLAAPSQESGTPQRVGSIERQNFVGLSCRARARIATLTLAALGRLPLGGRRLSEGDIHRHLRAMVHAKPDARSSMDLSIEAGDPCEEHSETCIEKEAECESKIDYRIKTFSSKPWNVKKKKFAKNLLLIWYK